MSNLVQEIVQDLIKHMCKLCDKSFSSGRSLGGHMRSHMIMVNSSPNHDHNGSSNSNDSVYELRKDPKKTSKVKDSSDQVEKLCKECGKGFQSWKALFGHMKCHSESRTSKSHNTNSRVKGGRIKKSRSKNSRIRRYLAAATTTATTITTASSSISLNDNSNQISSNHASTSIVSEIIQDHESEVALCLIMLSRDERKWGNEIESFDNMNSSTFVKLTKVEGKKPIENGPKVKEVEKSQIGSGKFLEIVIKNDEFVDENESGFGKFEESNKKKFECFTCNKSFHSYQALGGHKTSHKKLKQNLDSKNQIENAIENKPVFNYELMNNGFGSKPAENHHPPKSFNLGVNSLKKPLVLGSHKCRICSKVFSSGQALGGHKRSHMVAEAKLNQQKNMNRVEKVHEPANETRGFLDLNLLPDSMEEDMIINSSTMEYKPWDIWVDSTSHDSTRLGLFSTI